ncbi:MAG: HDOD domain-containing protein, partial [Thermodesulfovibrionales bacterium]
MPEDLQKTREYTLAKIRQSNDFPAMSSTITLLNKLDSKDDLSITEFANVILKDLALTTRILKIVNSVHFMQFGEVTTISRAIILLGSENVKNLAMTLILFDQLHKHKSNIPLMENILKSFYSALLAEKISLETNFADKEEAFICALFHTFGKIITAFVMQDKIADIEEFMKTNRTNESLASASVLGISFEEIGASIARDWNFPRRIVNSMMKMLPSELSKNQNYEDKSPT